MVGAVDIAEATVRPESGLDFIVMVFVGSDAALAAAVVPILVSPLAEDSDAAPAWPSAFVVGVPVVPGVSVFEARLCPYPMGPFTLTMLVDSFFESVNGFVGLVPTLDPRTELVFKSDFGLSN